MVGMPGMIHAVTGIEIYSIEVLVPIDFQPATTPAEQPARVEPLNWIMKVLDQREPNETLAAFARRVAPQMKAAERRGEVKRTWRVRTIESRISEHGLWPPE